MSSLYDSKEHYGQGPGNIHIAWVPAAVPVDREEIKLNHFIPLVQDLKHWPQKWKSVLHVNFFVAASHRRKIGSDANSVGSSTTVFV